MKVETPVTGSIEYQLKYYQILREIEKIRGKKKEIVDTPGSYSDLLKRRRGRSKF